jgi:hypothetical protein
VSVSLSGFRTLAILVILSACTNRLTIEYGRPQSAVRSTGPNEYVIYFKQAEIEAYGAPRRHYGKDREPALEQLLKAHPHLMPPACRTSGIELISTGDSEGGNAFAYFRCRESSKPD